MRMLSCAKGITLPCENSTPPVVLVNLVIPVMKVNH